MEKKKKQSNTFFDTLSTSFQKCILLILLHTWSTCKSFQRCFWVLWALIPSDRDPAHKPRWAGLPCDHHWLVYGRLLGWYGVDGMPGAAWWLREVGLVWDVWLAHMSTAGGVWHCSVWYDKRYVDVRNVRSQGLCRSSSVRDQTQVSLAEQAVLQKRKRDLGWKTQKDKKYTIQNSVFQSLGLVTFFSCFLRKKSYAHKGCIYLTKYLTRVFLKGFLFALLWIFLHTDNLTNISIEHIFLTTIMVATIWSKYCLHEIKFVICR